MILTILGTVFRRAANWLGLHPDVAPLISGGIKLTNPGQAVMPRENLHFASKIIASGMWNYSFFQFYRNFVGPYWVERQYDPNDLSFIPRAVTLLSVNITHRNWMGFRGSSSDSFALIDPAGAISPVVGYYSLEVALRENDKLRLPTRGEIPLKHKLLRDLPVPETRMRTQNGQVRVRAAGGLGEVVLIEIEHRLPAKDTIEICLGVRPFHPEGATLIHSMRLIPHGRGALLMLNNRPEIFLPRPPDRVYLSNLASGDAYFATEENDDVSCPTGLVTGNLVFRVKGRGRITLVARSYEREESRRRRDLPPPETRPRPAPPARKKRKKKHRLRPDIFIPAGEKEFLRGTASLDQAGVRAAITDAVSLWRKRLRGGARFYSGRESWNRAARIFSGYLLTLTRNDEITPGVFTYRSFFYRDAAFMLHALVNWNFTKEAERVLDTYRQRQLRGGFFRSQDGEWDSNGQAIWSLTDYYRRTGDLEFLRRNYNAIRRGAEWIIRKRADGPEKKIMPPGFSAEHLGPADHYYWDNLWSIAGLREAAFAANLLDRGFRENRWRTEAERYAEALREVSAVDRERLGLLTAAPGRPIDTGMIGSLCMLYPLELEILPLAELRKTVRTVYREFFSKGLFFHPIIHSGYNLYLSLHVAQCLFRLDEVRLARRIFNRVLARRSFLWTYPEAIHPLTGGGVMGDGFHGWAFAEVLNLLRQFTLFREGDTLVLFKGLRRKELYGAPLTFGPFPFDGTQVTVTGGLSEKGGFLRVNIPNIASTELREIRMHLPGLKKKKPRIQVTGGAGELKDGTLTIQGPGSVVEVDLRVK